MDETFHVIKRGVLYELQPEPASGFTISVPALPGCITFGETFEEAMTMVQDAMSGWLVVARKHGFDVPSQFDDWPINPEWLAASADASG